MSNLTPVPKVAAAVFAGAMTTLVVWGMKQYGNVDLPGEVAASLTTLITFAAGWITPSA